jgi:hypothetical protein
MWKFLLPLSMLCLTAKPAAADWLMIGPEDFRSSLPITVWADGVASSTANEPAWLFVPIRLPVGSTVNSLYCQVYDGSTGAVRIELHERYSDDTASLGSRRMIDLFSAYSANYGHQKIWTHTVTGSNVIRTWDNSAANNTNRYYSYYLSVYVPAHGYRMKTCALSYSPP